MENSGINVTFDVILIKNPSLPYDPKTDSIFTTNAIVTYLGKTGRPPSPDYISKVSYVNGFYSFSFQHNIGKCPACAGNSAQLASFFPNSAFTEMTAHQADPDGINFYSYGSWVSVMYYDGTPNNTKPIVLQEPLVLKRIKGPY